MSDRIRLVVHVDHHEDVRRAIEAHRELVMSAVLAVELLFVDDRGSCSHRIELNDGRSVHVGVVPIAPR